MTFTTFYSPVSLVFYIWLYYSIGTGIIEDAVFSGDIKYPPEKTNANAKTNDNMKMLTFSDQSQRQKQRLHHFNCVKVKNQLTPGKSNKQNNLI